jgi:hypothetical protein
MPQRFDILHLLPSEQPFAMLARAVRDVLVEATPVVYDQLRQARRADMERLVGAAAVHFRQITQEQRSAIADRLEMLARAQSVANLIEQPIRAVNDDAPFPPPELQALLLDRVAAE